MPLRPVRCLTANRELDLYLAAPPEAFIYVVEGEKDVDSLLSVGLIATCNSGGAGKFTEHLKEPLRGRRVVIIPDNDEEGRRHAQQVAQILYGVASQVKVVELPGAVT